MQRFINRSRLSARPIAPLLRPAFSTVNTNRMSAPQAAETDTQAADVANTTGVTSESIKKALESGVGAQHVDIEDMSGANPFDPWNELKLQLHLPA